MNTMDSIFKRSTCRRFTTEPLTAEETEQLLKAALAAPTGKNMRELRFAWISDPNLIQAISDCGFELISPDSRQRMKDRGAAHLFYQAPHLLVISALPSPYARIDAGVACGTVCLAAEAMGLATCINAMCAPVFDRTIEGHFCDALQMSADETFMIAVAVGHASAVKPQHQSDPAHIRYF